MTPFRAPNKYAFAAFLDALAGRGGGAGGGVGAVGASGVGGVVMRIEPVFKEKLEIGRFYLVPTVYGPLDFRMDYWPVLGPMHDDKEVIGFPLSHYHYDFRFFNADQWAYVLRYTGGGVVHGVVMCDNPDSETKPGPIIFRRRKCQREYPEFPFKRAESGWLPKLREKYEAVIMKDLTCPHKGASLRGLAVSEAGCVTCPLHGLRWNIETGELLQ